MNMTGIDGDGDRQWICPDCDEVDYTNSDKPDGIWDEEFDDLDPFDV